MTQRHSRMMALLTFINVNNPPGASITNIQSHMLKVYGLKFRTTSEMVQELTLAGAIKVDGHEFYRLTEKQAAALVTLAAQDKAASHVDQLTRRIDKVQDDAVRLQWKDVDFERRIITLNEPEKGSNPRIFSVLSGKLLNMLSNLPKTHDSLFGERTLN